jgi:hypothetical protein
MVRVLYTFIVCLAFVSVPYVLGIHLSPVLWPEYFDAD